MLPLVDKPPTQYVVEEARAAEINQFIFVTGRVGRQSKNISIATRNSLGICGARGRCGAGARRGAGGRDRLLWDCRSHARGGADRRALRHGEEARSGRDVVAACAHGPLRPAARCLRAACGAVARRHAGGEIQLTDATAAMERDAPLTDVRCRFIAIAVGAIDAYRIERRNAICDAASRRATGSVNAKVTVHRRHTAVSRQDCDDARTTC